MYVSVPLRLLFVMARLVSSCGLHRFHPFFVCSEFVLSSPLEGNIEKLNLLRGGYFFFLNRQFSAEHSFGIFGLGIVLYQLFHVPSRSFLTTFFPSPPTGVRPKGICFDGRREFFKVRVAWYAPWSSAEMKPLRRWAAAQKIACGCVGLLGRGVASMRCRGCLGLGLLPSL